MKVMRIKTMVASNNAFHFITNSPRQYDGKCKEISVERICMLMLGCERLTILVTSLFTQLHFT